MAIFWFAFCMIPDSSFDEGFKLARCYHWDRAVCEMYFDECYEGRVPTPVRRAK